MKSLALALMFVVATVAALPSQSKRSLERRDTTANINDYMDRVLNQTSVFLVTNNLDPFELNDRYLVNFTFKDLLGISWKTRLGLDRGEARGLSNIRRSGDAELAYTSDARTLHLQAAVIMDRIDVSYKYAAQVVNIGPAGTFTATVRGLNANLDIAINILKLNATLYDFSITSAKSIKVDVTGLTLLGNLATEAFINTFTFLLKGPILKVIENQVKFGLQAGISNTDPGPITISTSS